MTRPPAAPTEHAMDRWTTASGTRIHYLDNAPPHAAGLPILLSPGFTDTAAEYLEVLERFAATTVPRRLVVAEVRGRGESEAPASGFAAADHQADLSAVVASAGLDRFHLMTFSRGTTWALDLLLRAPDRVATLSIGDYRCGEQALTPAIIDGLLASRFRGRPFAERIEPRVARAVGAASVQRDLSGEIAASGIPVLVATGTEPGCILNDEVLTWYRERIPEVETVIVPGAGHDLFRGDRFAYPNAVLEFIARRAPGT